MSYTRHMHIRTIKTTLFNLNYLAYKALNNMLLFGLKVCLADQIFLSKKSGIVFDFSHKTTHLGDRLFYFPVMKMLIERDYQIYIVSGDYTTFDLFNSIYKHNIPFHSSNCTKEKIWVIPSASLLANLLNFYQRKIIVVRYDIKSELSVVQQIFNSLGQDIHQVNYWLPRDEKIKLEKPGIVIFSNYIDSGFFRKWFVCEEKLEKKCIELKKIGYKIWHVGTQMDKSNDKKKYKFVDRDLRGILSIEQVTNIIRNKNVTVVSYDNFIMHLGHLFNRKVFILFRGRFSKKHYDFHISSVNLCLSRRKGNSQYL